MEQTIKPDPAVAISLVNKGITLMAFSIDEHGKRKPWCKSWSTIDQLPIKTEHDIMSCIDSGCHGFQFRGGDAGIAVIDIDMKNGKNGLDSLKKSALLHKVVIPTSLLKSGYIVRTPNDGCHIYVTPDEWTEKNGISGILEGVDILSNMTRPIIVAGSIGIHKETGEWRMYEEMGHWDNIQPIPEQLSLMLKTIHESRIAHKEAERQRKAMESLSRQSRRITEGGEIFREANRRINRQIIESLFQTPGAYWETGKNGPEYFTLNPLRADNNIGSFSIRHDGIYYDFARDDMHGDFIDLVSKTYNCKPFDAARMIIDESGGRSSDYLQSSPGIKVSIGKQSSVDTIDTISYGEKSEVSTEKNAIVAQDEFVDDDPSQEEEKEDKKISALFPLKRLGEFSLEEDEWIIDRLFQADSLALTYGKPGVGKSFWTLDLSLCIATGKPFNGNEVKQGAVIYLAGEGHKGIYKRALAWQKHHGIDANDSPWWLAGRPFDLIDSMSVAEVLSAVDYHAQGVKPSLVVIDTLARNFGNGDENKTSDMGAVIRNADAIRVKYGCLVIIVHHSGHESDRARGSSALKAAMDFEYCVSQPEENALLVTNTRMKDGERPNDMAYKLTDIELGRKHKWGAEMKSAVLVEQEIDKIVKKNQPRLGANQELLIEILSERINGRKENLRSVFKDESNARVSKHEICEELQEHGIMKNNAYRLIKTMCDSGIIKADGNDLYLP